jgi:hypothetical protein
MFDPSAIRLGMPSDMFAAQGENRLAYVKAIRSEDVALLCADAPVLEPGHVVYVLHASDGTPIVLADSEESAAEGAANHELEMVRVH